MAEYVQLRKELSLTEYENMKKIKLFDEEELKKIKKTRESFEYKIERHTKDLKDYCEYIKYERSLLGIIADRRLVRHIKEKKAIERLIAMKIQVLYSKAVTRFPGDLRLWDSFIKFCRGTHFTSEIPAIHDRLLKLHISKPEVWLKAIMQEYSDIHNIVRIKHLLTSGLKLHPKDINLNKAFIQIELNEVQTISDSETLTEDQKQKDIGIALNHCESVYNSIKTSMDLDFYIEILQITLQYHFAHSFSRKILIDLQTNFKNHAKVWNCFAQSELSGITLFDPVENVVAIVRGPRTTKVNIEKCIAVYEHGIKILPCQEMHSMYIDAMLELNDSMTSERNLRRMSLANAFKAAYESDFISEKHYVIYLKLLLEGDSINTGKMEEIFNKALKTNSVEIWKLRLVYSIKFETQEKLDSLFEIITKTVKGDEVLELYKIMFTYLAMTLNNSAVENFLKKAIKNENRKVSDHFKPEYIEWACIEKNLQEARKIYKDLTLNTPPCLGIHQKMVQLEIASFDIDLAEVRRCFDYAIQLFGFKEVSIWIEYIRFERRYGNPLSTTNLYERAKATLKGDDLIQKFIQEHSLLQSNS